MSLSYDDPLSNLLSGIVNALSPVLVQTLTVDNPLLATDIIYGTIDPQDVTVTFPVVSYTDIQTVPAETPGLAPSAAWTADGNGTTATQLDFVHYYLTLVDLNIWTTNATDRSMLSAAVHSVLDPVTDLLTLPDTTTAKVIFQKEMKFAPEPMRHLYRTCLTYLCKHKMVRPSAQYLVLTPIPTYGINGVAA